VSTGIPKRPWPPLCAAARDVRTRKVPPTERGIAGTAGRDPHACGIVLIGLEIGRTRGEVERKVSVIVQRQLPKIAVGARLAARDVLAIAEILVRVAAPAPSWCLSVSLYCASAVPDTDHTLRAIGRVLSK
jgi:hypothetical protein